MLGSEQEASQFLCFWSFSPIPAIQVFFAYFWPLFAITNVKGDEQFDFTLFGFGPSRIIFYFLGGFLGFLEDQGDQANREGFHGRYGEGGGVDFKGFLGGQGSLFGPYGELFAPL